MTSLPRPRRILGKPSAPEPVENWIPRVRLGEFGAIPEPFTWNDSAELAHLIGGYKTAEEIGLGRLGPFVNMKSDIAAVTGSWDGTAAELWLCLFYEHRRARHLGVFEGDGAEAMALDPLCAALRHKLQAVQPQEKALLLGWLAKAQPLPDDVE